jgi:hypothetical protein
MQDWFLEGCSKTGSYMLLFASVLLKIICNQKQHLNDQISMGRFYRRPISLESSQLHSGH